MRVSCPKSSFKWTWPRVWPRCARTHKLARYCTVHLFCLSLKKKINLTNHREEKERREEERQRGSGSLKNSKTYSLFACLSDELGIWPFLLATRFVQLSLTALHYDCDAIVLWRAADALKRRGWARAARLFQTLSILMSVSCVCVVPFA